MAELLSWDQQVFLWINNGWSSPILEVILPLLREKTFWVPLYLFFVVFWVANWPHRFLTLAVITILLITTADTISSQWIKKTVKRPRPCHVESPVYNQVILRTNCGGGYSFTSSHATNHFAVASFLALTFGQVFSKSRPILFLWASAVSISQVYVGVHYPIDIMVGGIIGSAIGVLYAYFYQYICAHLNLPLA